MTRKDCAPAAGSRPLVARGAAMKVHVYRNRPDDNRTRGDLHFCSACGGWYGAPHESSHCQERHQNLWMARSCACRFCREAAGKPIEGDYGFFTEAKRWQP